MRPARGTTPPAIRHHRDGLPEDFTAVYLRPLPKLIAWPEIWPTRVDYHASGDADRCRLYYNQPLWHGQFLALKYIVSTPERRTPRFGQPWYSSTGWRSSRGPTPAVRRRQLTAQRPADASLRLGAALPQSLAAELHQAFLRNVSGVRRGRRSRVEGFRLRTPDCGGYGTQ